MSSQLVRVGHTVAMRWGRSAGVASLGGEERRSPSRVAVLDLNAVDYGGRSAGALWRALGQEGGRFVAFFIAFWVIARFWQVHHRVFRRITRNEDSLAAHNFWFLFGISVLPFTTRLLGETKDNPLPVTMFSANLLLVSLALTWLTWGADRTGASEPQTDERQLLMTRARTVTTATLFVLPGALAWVIAPGTAELLYLLLFLADVPGQLALRGASSRRHSAARASLPTKRRRIRASTSQGGRTGSPTAVRGCGSAPQPA